MYNMDRFGYEHRYLAEVINFEKDEYVYIPILDTEVLELEKRLRIIDKTSGILKLINTFTGMTYSVNELLNRLERK